MVFSGSFWISLLRVSSRSLAVIKTIIIARLLGPFELGTFALSSITLSLLEIMSETGINITLLQENNSSDELVDSAWIVSIFRGLLLSGIIIILAFILPSYFNNKNLFGLLILTSVIPTIRGFLNPSIIKLQKNMLYKKDFEIRIFLYILDAIVSISLALYLRNAYCIVIGQIVYAIFELFISWIIFKPNPKWKFNKNKLKLIFHRGKWITLSGIFDYIFHNFDSLVIGKIMGSYYLGIYNTVYKISILPITESGEIVSKVTLPVLIKIRGDKNRLKKAFLKVLKVISILLIPITFIGIIFADKLLLIFLR